ncbi:MAG: RNA methyltransferase [Myxococcales bacterium]|nr:RNA methyltransferase [Myxococcales bacterium]
MRRDDPDVDEITGPPGLPDAPARVIAALSPLVTPSRLRRIEAVAGARSLAVVPVLESLSDPHNGAAVLRTADAVGAQRVDVVAGPGGFLAAKGVSKGTHRWLDVHLHPSASACVRSLRRDGYRVYAGVMDGEHTPRELARYAPVALVFGNERRGVSPELRALADGTFRVPMRGFVESLNISVAAAVSLYGLIDELAHLPPDQAAAHALSEDAKQTLIARYLMATVRDAEAALRRALAPPPTA